MCESRPRAVRLQCGHIFACAECVERLDRCAICRETIDGIYNIMGKDVRMQLHADDAHDVNVHAVTDGESFDGCGYVSSGSESYRSTRRHNLKCGLCLDDNAFLREGCCVVVNDTFELCDSCANELVCPHCGQTGRDLLRLCNWGVDASTVVTHDELVSADGTEACFYCTHAATMKFCCPRCSGPGPESMVGRASYMLCNVCVSNEACRFCGRPAVAEDVVVDVDQDVSTEDSVNALANTSEDIHTYVFDKEVACISPEEVNAYVCSQVPWQVSQTGRAVINRCAQYRQNTIWETAQGGAEKTHVPLEILRRRRETAQHTCKAVFLAPTVPLVKQHLEVASKCHEQIRVQDVIGSTTVDAWGISEWSSIVAKTDVLITTPQLFVDVLDAKFLQLHTFGLLIVDECHHCAGSHPFVRVFAEHYCRLESKCNGSEPLVLGMSGNLVKRKVKDIKEREKAVKKLENVMRAQVMPQCG